MHQPKLVKPSAETDLERISPANTVHRILAGSACSANDDRTEDPPVRFAGVEQGSDPVVLEVAEAEADALDPLDQVVERFGGSSDSGGEHALTRITASATKVLQA